MSMNMTKAEREAFLQEPRVGVISIEQDGEAPLSAPVWYDYHPDVGLWFLTDPGSRKGRALARSGRFTLVVQTETAPYKYVSVSGSVVEERPAEFEADTRAMAARYLDEETLSAYLAVNQNDVSNYYLMRPEKWLTLDYTKMELVA